MSDVNNKANDVKIGYVSLIDLFFASGGVRSRNFLEKVSRALQKLSNKLRGLKRLSAR